MNRKFANAPYGWDNLSKAMILIGAIMFALGGYIIKMFGLAIFIYAIYRSMSRNNIARKRESVFFDKMISNATKYINNAKNNIFRGKKSTNFKNPIINIKDRMVNAIVKCPYCNQKLRLPKGKGNIIVTCASCKNEFKIRT